MIETFRGDVLEIPCEVVDSKGNLFDLTDHEIRAELNGPGISIKKATSNVPGGSDEEIKVIGTGQFIVCFTPSETSQLNPNSTYIFEVEITSPDGKVLTIIQEEVKVLKDIITWKNK